MSEGINAIEFISLDHRLPREKAKPGMMQGPAEVPYQIADIHLPWAVAVFDAATALDTAVDVADPQPTLVELLVRPVLSRASACHKPG